MWSSRPVEPPLRLGMSVWTIDGRSSRTSVNVNTKPTVLRQAQAANTRPEPFRDSSRLAISGPKSTLALSQ